MNLRITFPANAWPMLVRHANALLSGGIIALGLALLVALRLGWIDILRSGGSAPADTVAIEPAAPPTTVQLPPEKLAAADLSLATTQLQPVQSTRTVPGSITYATARRLPVNSPVAGVVVKVLVEPGEQVAAHQPLAELSSPEVGLARDEAQKREADLELARHEEGRRSRIADNVEALLVLLQQKPTVAAVEAAVEERSFGEYREKIVGAYSKLMLAERTERDTARIGENALSGRLVEERKSAREVAAAQFATACDLARFECRRDQEKAKFAREQAERLLAVAQQAVQNLLGPLADMTPVTDRNRLSELRLLAPLAGRIEERHAVQNARVTAGGPLFTIGDTSVLWVSAEIHERDWAALDVAQQGAIAVRVPALNNLELQAQVRFVGAQVAETTRSVPLVAELPNAGGRLKPGMFVWVEVPLALPREALVIPAGAIMRHENQPFVFVPAGDGAFRRVDVEIGLTADSRVEITSGLKLGDTVVDHGAFFLKSELLLEREE